MATNENSFGLGDAKATGPQSPRPTLHPLHEAALRLTEMGPGRKRAKTKDLIGLLLCHGARAWRQSQPVAVIHLHVASHGGKFPVILRSQN